MSDLPFPLQPASEAEREQRFSRYVETRTGVRSFEFRIDLPPLARPVDAPPRIPNRLRPLSSLGVYACLEGPPLSVQVVGGIVDREIAPADWLLPLLESFEHEPLEVLRYPTVAGDGAHVLTRGSHDGRPTLARWRALKDSGPFGGRMFAAAAQTSEEDYPTLADDLFQIVHSVRLTRPSGYPLAERLEVLHRDVPLPLHVLYPTSWVLHEEVDDSPLLAATFIHEHEGVFCGRMTLYGARLPSADRGRLLDAYLGSLETMGLRPRLSEVAQGPLGNVARASWYEGAAEDDELSFDLAVGIARVRDGWLLAARFGAARSALPNVAAVNERAFEILTRHLQTEL